MKIFIDPGHGGKDPGAVNTKTGLTEAFVNLDVAQRLNRILKKRNYQTKMSRTTDIFVNLSERANMANCWNANYFISIHCNSHENNIHRGTETYYYKYATLGKDLAKTVQHQLFLQLKLRNIGIKPANFAVLRLSKMHSILAELAFISNSEDEALLATATFREKCAQGLADGITEFLRIK